MDFYTATIVASLIVYVVVGGNAGRRIKQLDDYYVAGRQAPTLLIVGTLVASVFSTSIFMGEAAFTYDGQLGAYTIYPDIAVMGYVIGALAFGTYLRRSRAPTVADFFGQRFQSRRVQQAAGVTIIVGLGLYLLVVTQGAAILFSELTELSYAQGLLLSWVSYTLFTMYAGSKGVILTDTLMFLLFTGATAVFVVVIVSDFGGMAGAITQVTAIPGKEGIAAWHGIIGPGTEWATPFDFFVWMVTMGLAWGAVYAVGPWQASRHLMARDEHVVIRAATYACLVVIVMQLMIYGAGGIINIAKADITPSEAVIIWGARNLVPPLLGALLLAGIVAAALSSASTFLSLVGFSVSNDVMPSKTALSLGATRLIMLATGIVVLIASFFFPPNIFWLMLFIGTVFASSWGPVGLMSVWSRRITSDAAFWGIVTGFVFNVGPAGMEYAGFIDLPVLAHPAILGTVASILAILVVSRRGTVTEAERRWREQLHEPPAEDVSAEKTRLTLGAPAALIAFGAAMPPLLLNFYVRPYQAATGTLAADGGINWSMGEPWFAMGDAFLYIPLGLIAARVIKRRYGGGSGGR